MTAPDVAPDTKSTFPTSALKTEKSFHETPDEHSIRTFVPGHEESEDKKEEIVETLEDDWETDPENARNWPAYKRWGSMLIVRRIIYAFLLFFFFHQPLPMNLGFALYILATPG